MKKKIAIIAVVSLLVLGGAGYTYMNLNIDKSDSTALIQKIGRHYLLPSKEEPVIATVTDRTKLTTEFLKAARNGDKLLVYEKSGVAIIYRPSIDKLVRVGPVSIAPTDGSPATGTLQE